MRWKSCASISASRSRPLTPDDAERLGLSLNGGLIITHVDPHSAAGEAGLRKDAIIVAIGSREITDGKSLPKELLQLQSGIDVRLQVIVLQSMGPLTVQRGGSVLLTAR